MSNLDKPKPYGDGDGNGNGYGYGDSLGYGNGDSSGSGYGEGSCYGYGEGYGHSQRLFKKTSFQEGVYKCYYYQAVMAVNFNVRRALCNVQCTACNVQQV